MGLPHETRGLKYCLSLANPLIWRRTMSNPIRNSLFSYAPLSTAPSSPQPRQNSFQQVAAQTQQAQMTLVTDEGDIVTLSRSGTQAQAISTAWNNTPVSYGQQYTIAGLNTDSLSVAVRGDLNEEELADIKRLVDDLVDIATNFFSGNINAEDAVLAGTTALDDTGSISQLSAIFSYTAVSSSRLTESHPVPVLNPGMVNRFEKVYESAAMEQSGTHEYTDLLRAQWEQINKFLTNKFLDQTSEEKSEPAAQQPPPEKPAMAPSRQMVEQIQDTIIRHPRLSPFALALADRAVDNAANRAPGQVQREMVHMRNQLRTSLFREFTDWLLPA